MCKWGNEIHMPVLVSADMSYTGKQRWAVKGVDSCIADIVKVLNDAGLYTMTCCCGHGKRSGEIKLYDGRNLIIRERSKL